MSKRNIFAAIILSFVGSFMLFIYEPITMYANNVNDFWFDLYTILGPLVGIFFVAFIGVSLALIALGFILSKLKHPKIYNYTLVAAFACFLCAYVHGNFLAGMLPPLDGTTPNWGEFQPNLISILICVAIIVLAFVCFRKLKTDDIIKYSTFGTMAIFAILTISLITTITTTSVLEKKEVIPSYSLANINTVSKNKNFMILLLDAVDSQNFNKIVESKTEYKATFKDFTYFPDTVSGYAFTRDSIPFILSNQWNTNEKQFQEYSTEAFDNSAFLAALKDQKYQRNLYSEDIVWNSDKAFKIDNVISNSSLKEGNFLKQEAKYILFKYLPWPLKRFSHIDSMDFSLSRTDVNDIYSCRNDVFYHQTLEQPLTTINDNYFQFVHLEGGHVPFNMDENVNLLDQEGTYEQKLEASMKIVQKYIQRLKDNDAYDKSVIVVMADHGYWHNGTNRQNPIFYIKGINEHGDSMKISDKQISHEDLNVGFSELLERKKSTEIFQTIPAENRIRRYLYNGFNEEEHMIEYEQTGKAWDLSTFKPTGKEFNL